MNFIWSLIFCLMFILHELHAMPFDFGDPMSIDFARILKETELARAKIEDSKQFDHSVDIEQQSYHPRHHIKKHRRSLKPISTATKTSNSKEYVSIPELNLSHRSKHLMLTKPYWAWP